MLFRALQLLVVFEMLSNSSLPPYVSLCASIRYALCLNRYRSLRVEGQLYLVYLQIKIWKKKKIN